MLITRGLGSILEITTHISTSIVHANLLLEFWSELVDPPCFRDDAISSPEGAASSDAVASFPSLLHSYLMLAFATIVNTNRRFKNKRGNKGILVCETGD